MTRRSLAAALATGVLALLAGGAGPAQADEQGAPAGAVELPGEEVDMSSEQAEPTPVTAGLWRGTLGESEGPDETRWFSYRRETEDSTLLVSVVSPGADPAVQDGVEVEVLDAAGDRCTFTSASSTRSDGDPRLLTALTVIGVQQATLTDEEESSTGGGFECLTESRLLIAVSRGSSGEGGDAPFAMRVVEESSLASADGLGDPVELGDPEVPDVDAGREDLDGATGFADAPEAPDGRYRGSTTTDRSVLYRVPDVGWGQTLRTALDVAPVELAEDVFSGPTVSLRVLTPMLTTVGTTGSDDASLSDSGSVELLASAGPVGYLNRRADLDPAAYVPGDHYVLVTVEPPDEGEPLDVDYTLEVEVAGEEADAPDFTEADAYVVAEGDAQPTITGVGAGGLLATVGAVVRYGVAGLLAVVGLVALLGGVRTLRS